MFNIRNSFVHVFGYVDIHIQSRAGTEELHQSKIKTLYAHGNTGQNN